MKTILGSGLLLFILVCVGLPAALCRTRYEPNWKSLDARPLPGWYDEGKIGIFLHWGVFSVPAYGSAWFWYYLKAKNPAYVNFMKQNYRPGFTYADFAPLFRAEFYDPDKWADIFQASGAKYIVLITKHHEGFTNWPSKYSWNWNAMDVGPKRDLVGDLAKSLRNRTDLKFGVYHSLFEFFNPLYLRDAANGYHTQDFVRTKTMPELYELVNKYKPDVIWSDGDWVAADTYWNSTEFLAWLYNDSPVRDTVVVNDRWGNNTRCKHGDFWDCSDKYRPGKIVPHKWEDCMTLDKYAWTYRKNANLADFLTMNELLTTVVSTVSLGGNVLINAGPTAWGEITPIFEDKLRQLGSWLKVNGEAIYGTKSWSHQNDSVANVWYTSKTNGQSTTVYAIMLSWPEENQITLGFPVASASTSVSMLGYGGYIFFLDNPGGGMTIMLPQIPESKMPCKYAWVLKLTGLVNQKSKLNWSAFSRNIVPNRMGKDLP